MDKLELLRNWAYLNRCLHALSETEVKELLDHELVTKQRPDILNRLFVRYQKMRNKREREELTQLITGGKGK